MTPTYFNSSVIPVHNQLHRMFFAGTVIAALVFSGMPTMTHAEDASEPSTLGRIGRSITCFVRTLILQPCADIAPDAVPIVFEPLTRRALPQEKGSVLGESTEAETPPIVNQSVIERIIERVVPAQTIVAGEYVEPSALQILLADLELRLNQRISSLGQTASAPLTTTFSGGGASASPAFINTFGLSQKIDQLSGTSLTNVTVSGVSGLTDSDIPNDITASNYLPLTGGSITGDLNLSGTLTAGALSVSSLSSGGALTGPYVTATSSVATSTFAGGITGPNDFIVQSGSGNVGIGTQTPTSTLDIRYGVGGVQVGHGTTLPAIDLVRSESFLRFAGFNLGRLNFTGTADSFVSEQVGAYINSQTEGTGTFTWQNAPSANLIFATTPNESGGVATERLRITGSGNVGIGTTSPYAKLSVAGTVAAANFAATSTSATSTFAGGVGIGTVNPQATLDVRGRVLLGADSAWEVDSDGHLNWYSLLSLGWPKDQVGGINFLKTAGGTNHSVALGSFDDGEVGLWGGTSGLGFYVNASEKMRISSTSRVGIGTTSPYAKLSVVGPVVAEYFHATSTTATSIFGGKVSIGTTTTYTNYPLEVQKGAALWRFNEDSKVLSYTSMANGSVGWSLGSPQFGSLYHSLAFDNGRVRIGSDGNGGTNSLILETNDSERMRVTQSGNVGIGTTTPGVKLVIQADSDTYPGSINFEAMRASAPFTDSSVGTGLSFTNFAGTSKVGGMYVNNSGVFQLESSAGSKLTFNTSYISGTRFAATNAGSLAIPSISLSTATGDEVGFYLPATNVMGFITDRLERARFDANGNLGIGTSSPYAKLSVVGPVVAEYFHATSTMATSTFAGAVSFASPTVNASSNVHHYRNVASYSSDSNPVTGTMLITLPKLWSNTNLNITIRGFNYIANNNMSDWEVHISGRNYSAGQWHGYGAEIRGGAPFTEVRLSDNGTSNVILLGTTATQWGVPHLTITDVLAGQANKSGWDSGWRIEPITSEATITGTIYTPTAAGAGRLIFSTPTSSIPISTNQTHNSFLQLAGSQYSRWGVYDPGTGISGRASYIQGGFTGSALYYNTLLNPLGGNVGVGATTTPNAKLSVKGVGSTSGVNFQTTNSSDSPLFTILDSGNVGAGSSSPYAKLSVTNTGAGPSFVVEDSASPDTTPFIIDASGNVGIGTTSPSTKLSISSTGFCSTCLPTAGSASTGGQPARAFLGDAANAYGLLMGGRGDGAFFLQSQRIDGNTSLYDLFLNPIGGNIAVGTSTADSRLSVQTSGTIDILNLFEAGGVEVFTVLDSGNVGIGTTTPWRTLSVSGTVGFDGLTGATGAGSLCLDSNNQVVYNSASDACLPSLRETKRDIAPLNLSALDLVSALESVSFVYNQGDGRTRYGFIAEDAAAVDPRLATYNASGTISGIDDRALLSVLMRAMREMWGEVQGYFARTDDLENEVEALRSRVNELEQHLNVSQPAAAAVPAPTPSPAPEALPEVPETEEETLVEEVAELPVQDEIAKVVPADTGLLEEQEETPPTPAVPEESVAETETSEVVQPETL